MVSISHRLHLPKTAKKKQPYHLLHVSLKKKMVITVGCHYSLGSSSAIIHGLCYTKTRGIASIRYHYGICSLIGRKNNMFLGDEMPTEKTSKNTYSYNADV